jgi:hypothetical protein
MADQQRKPRTTNPMYPQIEYRRVERDGVQFTTAKSSVTKDMRVLKDADAVDKRGNPLPPTTKTSTGKSGDTKSGSGSAASDQA